MRYLIFIIHSAFPYTFSKQNFAESSEVVIEKYDAKNKRGSSHFVLTTSASDAHQLVPRPFVTTSYHGINWGLQPPQPPPARQIPKRILLNAMRKKRAKLEGKQPNVKKYKWSFRWLGLTGTKGGLYTLAMGASSGLLPRGTALQAEGLFVHPLDLIAAHRRSANLAPRASVLGGRVVRCHITSEGGRGLGVRLGEEILLRNW
jgi:hypothetical protein